MSYVKTVLSSSIRIWKQSKENEASCQRQTYLSFSIELKASARYICNQTFCIKNTHAIVFCVITFGALLAALLLLLFTEHHIIVNQYVTNNLSPKLNSDILGYQNKILSVQVDNSERKSQTHVILLENMTFEQLFFIETFHCQSNNRC